MNGELRHDFKPCPEPWDLQYYTRRILQGDAPDDEIGEHLTRCDACLHELSEIQRDLIHLEGTRALEGIPSFKIPTFRIDQGLLPALLRFAFFQPGPAFRSGGHSVIHSTIIPLPHNYVLLELTGADSGMQLHLEKGAKNGDQIRISLYINDQLSDKRKLHDSLSWDIHAFSPGRYRLQLEEKTVLTFDIKE